MLEHKNISTPSVSPGVSWKNTNEKAIINFLVITSVKNPDWRIVSLRKKLINTPHFFTNLGSSLFLFHHIWLQRFFKLMA